MSYRTASRPAGGSPANWAGIAQVMAPQPVTDPFHSRLEPAPPRSAPALTHATGCPQVDLLAVAVFLTHSGLDEWIRKGGDTHDQGLKEPLQPGRRPQDSVRSPR